MNFPKDFIWGVAAAAYQIEGGAYEDGKGLNTWDVFCKKPGAIWSGHTGDVACDHYHRFQEDVALMKQLGVKGYRLSINWSRVMPAGTGAVNVQGLDFYQRLVDALRAAGIQPLITLFHWDYPYALHCRGGWLNRDCADWFAEYAALIVARLSDRVTHWMTLNEPQCFVLLGHETGELAPGYKLARPELLRAAHHALLAHGRGVQAIRAAARQPCQVGYAPVGHVCYPADETPDQIEAARRMMFRAHAGTLWQNALWMEPVFTGRYPDDFLTLYGAELPPIRDDDLATIAQPLDFCGVNVYHGQPVWRGAGGEPVNEPHPPGFPLTAYKWPVTPEALYWGPRFFHERYGKPLIITENGLSGADWVMLDGKVHDPQRIDFLTRYLRQLKRACADGIPVRGYLQWSIMDNFEWAQGYKERFGLIHVDYVTQRRTPKDSYWWYKDVIASNGAVL